MFSSKALGAKLALFSPAITGLVNNDPVSTWSDLSGNGNDATASGAQRPVWIAQGVAGLPVVRFSGSQVMTHSLSLGSSPAAAVIVAKVNTASGNPGIFASCAPNSALGINFNSGYSSTAIAAYYNSFVYGSVSITGAWHILTQSIASYSATGGVEIGTDGLIDVRTGAGTYGGDSLERRVIGAGDTAAGYMSGDIGCIIVWDSAVSLALRGRVQQAQGYTFRIATH